MPVSQKCQYALRAIFELAKRQGQGLVKIGQIAEAQAIPQRFLEAILSQLKEAGFVESKRGNSGGYQLIRPARQVTVGEVIRFVQGPIEPVKCVSNHDCSLYGDCVFLGMWQSVQQAVSDVYDRTTFADLVEQSRRKNKEYVPGYSI